MKKPSRTFLIEPFYDARLVASALIEGGNTAPAVGIVPPTPEPPSDPIGDGLRADAWLWLKMDEASGSALDATSASRTFVQVGTIGADVGLAYATTRLFPGPNNTAGFARSNVDVRFGDIDTTFIFWWYETQSPTGDPYWYNLLWSQDDYSGGYQFGLNQGGQMFGFNGYDNNGFVPFHVNIPNPRLNVWHMGVIAYTTSDQLLRGGIDLGTPVASLAAHAHTVGGGPVHLGYNDGNDGSNTFAGQIGPVGIWKRALTSDELTYLWNDRAGRTLYP